MYLLYADDSGLAGDKSNKYCVLAGFATNEVQTYWIQKAIDDIMLKATGRNDLELHASPIRSGKNIWRTFKKEQRESILQNSLKYIADHYPNQFILFGAVIKNDRENVEEELFTQITSRFDKFLQRKFIRKSESARGLAIFDKSKMEQQYQNWMKIYQDKGNSWGQMLHNFAEVPLFLDSAISRNLQVADLIAYSLYRKFEYDDDTYYSIIKDCFDTDKKTQHGLYLNI